jgi:hypothetical protein
MAKRLTPGEKLVASALVKMHKVVGIDRTWNEIVEYAKDNPKWYSEHTWPSPEAEAKFRKWLHTKLMKSLHLTQLGAQKELEMFMLMWGWSKFTPAPAPADSGPHPALKDTDG